MWWRTDSPSSEVLNLLLTQSLVSVLYVNGELHRGAAEEDGVALVAAHRRKERTNPELVGLGARARLVVRVVVGGRWSREAQIFLRLLSRARARRERFLMRKRVEQVWRLRWRSLLSCTAARAVARHVRLTGVGLPTHGSQLMSHHLLLARTSEPPPSAHPRPASCRRRDTGRTLQTGLEALCVASGGTDDQRIAKGSAMNTADLAPKRLRPTIGLHPRVSWR